MKNGKKLEVKVLVDSGYTHTGIDEQLVKDKRIQTKPINFLFEVFNANRIKNGEVTKVASLEIKINRHKKTLCHKLYSTCISTISGPIFTN